MSTRLISGLCIITQNESSHLFIIITHALFHTLFECQFLVAGVNFFIFFFKCVKRLSQLLICLKSELHLKSKIRGTLLFTNGSVADIPLWYFEMILLYALPASYFWFDVGMRKEQSCMSGYSPHYYFSSFICLRVYEIYFVLIYKWIHKHLINDCHPIVLETTFTLVCDCL